MSKKRDGPLRIERWLVIFLVVYFLLGTVVGIWINRHYYAMERGEMNSPQEDQDASP
jgi:uncharacterized protein YneF (UPF0154 family)